MSESIKSEKIKTEPHTHLINSFFLDTIELFLISFIYKVISNNPSSFLILLRNSLVLAAIFTMLNMYNITIKNSVKQGVLASLGASMFKVYSD